MAITWIGLLLYIRVIKPVYLLRRPYRIVSVRQERGDTLTLVMKPDGHGGFRFTPGQFAWLTVGRTPFRIAGHPFSFSSSAPLTTAATTTSIPNPEPFTRPPPHT